MKQQKFQYMIETKGTIVKEVYTLEEIEAGLFFGNLAFPRNIIARRQLTGKIDINGADIHEGDIVKWGHIKGWSEEVRHRVAEVELFPSLQFRILHYINKDTLKEEQTDNYVFEYRRFSYKNTEKYLEVIGNIYENKELLKGE